MKAGASVLNPPLRPEETGLRSLGAAGRAFLRLLGRVFAAHRPVEVPPNIPRAGSHLGKGQ